MHILHLVDLREGADEPVLACRAALLAPAEHRVVGIGAARHAARARALGLRLDDLVSPPASLTGPGELAFRRLRRLLGDRDGAGGNATRAWADLVQCWSTPMLGLARLASGRRTPPRIGALLRPPPASAAASRIQDLRHRFALHDATLFTFDRSCRSAWAAPASARRGGTLLEQNIRLLPAPALAGRFEPVDRESLRRRMGLKPDDTAVALLADPAASASAYRLAFTLGLLYTTGRPIVGIVPRGCGEVHRARRFMHLHGDNWSIISPPGHIPIAAAVHACDAAVWDATDASKLDRGSSGSLLLTMAMAAGVLVIAGEHPVAHAALGACAPELIARDRTLNALADRLLWALNAPAARERAIAACRAQAQQADRAFTDTLLHLWQEAANVPVIRPGLPVPTALAMAGSAA